MINCLKYKKIGSFLGSVLFSTAGAKVLASTDARKFYINCLATSLWAKDYVVTTATSIQENTEGILAEAKEVNVKYRQEKVFKDESGAKDRTVPEETVEGPVNVITE